MAQEKKASYPMLPVAHWWQLREKFKQSIPGIVTDAYLAAALNTQPGSARVNILPYLKTIGLIDEEGKTQELARAWRDDAEYPEVCKKIKEMLYPDDLISAVADPSADREAVERWFSHNTGVGKSAAGRMTSFYILLSERDVSKRPEKKASKKQVSRTRKGEPSVVDKREPDTNLNEGSSHQSAATQPNLPSVNINLEIHISADATPDQIDKIFESMAKHIYRK